MKPGDVVLIRFPNATLKPGKLRPAVVIAIAPGRHPDILLSLVTSRIYQAVSDFDEIIDLTDPDYSTTGLKVKSVVRLARLVSVETSIIKARLGTISATRLHQIRTRLGNWLAG